MAGEVGQLGSGRSGSHDRTVTEVQTVAYGDPHTVGGTQMGASLGRYVVVEEVGRGGMGRVLRAYDPKLQREVALKELRGQALGADGARRLVTEARAMAKLSHPNVVGIHDVEEVDDGRVVLVMEYVAGQTLKAWLREAARTWPAVVQCLVQAGQGLAAAHAAGLLHRDFKPGNVLVAQDGTAKVTDFGLAKLGEGATSMDEPDGEDEERTAAGTVKGTPRYMAPEQHRGESLTPAADQYGFCVTVWEALCGEPPFAGQGLAAQKGRGPPPWPDGPTPRRIVEAVRRGLQPEPTERWPSMVALLEVLADDLAKRRWWWVSGLSAVGVLGVGAVGLQAWIAARAERCSPAGAEAKLAGAWDEARRAEVHAALLGVEASYAAAVWERTAAVLDAYAAAFVAMHVEACEATSMRGEQSPQVLDLRMACLHRASVELSAVTAVLAEADANVVRKAHGLVASLRPLERCADVVALEAEVEPPLPEEAEAVATARGHLAAARAAGAAGRYAEAQAEFAAAQASLEQVEYGPVQTEVTLVQGRILDSVGEFAEAEAALRDAVRLAGRWRQWSELGEASGQLVYVIGYRQQRFAEGLLHRDLALGVTAGDAVSEAAVHNSIAAVLDVQGEYEAAADEHRRALALREEAFGPDHPDVAASRANLAAVLFKQGKNAEAEAEQRHALAMREAALGPDHPDVAASRTNLGGVLFAQGKYAEAEAEHRRALAVLVAALGADHPSVAATRSNLATALHVLGRYAEAEAEHRQALAVRKAALGPDHPEVATSQLNLGAALQAQGQLAEAEAEYRAALSLWEAALGPDHPDVAASRHNLATLLKEQGKHAEAEAEQRRALALWEAALGSDHPDVATARHALAASLLERGEVEEAHALAQQAWERRQRDDTPAEDRAGAAFVLARTTSARGDRARARDLAERARSEYARAGKQDDVARVDAWLVRHGRPPR